MEHLRPIESKSKAVVRLEVHLPGMVRRGSRSKGPKLIAERFTHALAAETNDGMEDLRDLDYLTIEFADAEGMQLPDTEHCRTSS